MKNFFLVILIFFVSNNILSQVSRSIEAESSVVTNHFVTVNGTRIPYSATAGTLPVWSEDDNAVATLFYTYYKRSDVKDIKNRPIFFSFNGGPGAASIWMHMGYTSPRTLNIDDEGYPVQPYGIKDNPHSIIDVADIVYVKDPLQLNNLSDDQLKKFILISHYCFTSIDLTAFLIIELEKRKKLSKDSFKKYINNVKKFINNLK